MQIRKVMTIPAITGASDASIREIARLMRDHDIGLIPIVLDGSPVGVLTDRDIVTRILPVADVPAEITAAQTMSDHPVTCHMDQDVAEAASIMGDN